MRTLTKISGFSGLFLTLILALGFGHAAQAQGGEATFQLFHGSPDAAVSTVDIVVTTNAGGAEVISGFNYNRVDYKDATARDTAFWSVGQGFPSNDSIVLYVNYYVNDVATPDPFTSFALYADTNGTANVRDTIVLHNGNDYILIPEGVVDPSSFPAGTAPFQTTVIEAAAPTAGQVALAWHHGSPDFGAVDINSVINFVPSSVATNAGFGATTAFNSYPAQSSSAIFDLFNAGTSNRISSFFISTLIPPQQGGPQYDIADSRRLVIVTGFGDASLGSGLELLSIDEQGNSGQIIPGTFYQFAHYAEDDAAQDVQFLLEPTPGQFSPLPTTYDYGDVSGVDFLPAVGQMHVVPNGGAAGDALTTIDLNSLDVANYQYLVATGIVPGSQGYNVNSGTDFEVLQIPELAPESTDPSQSEIVLVHASPDAPTIDVKARDGGTVVSNLSYGNYEIVTLGTDGFLMDLIEPGTNGEEAYHTFRLRSSVLGTLQGNRVMAVAAGFRDSTVNNNGPDFGANTVVLNGISIPLEEVTTATVSVIHNSADPAAASVDVYYDTVSTPALDDFQYGHTSGRLQLLANEDVRVSVNASNSTGQTDQVLLEEPAGRFLAGEEYFVVVDGFADPSNFETNPSGNSTALDFYTKMADNREPDVDTTELYVFHGATDAPAVDLVETAIPLTAVDGATYGDFGGSIRLADGTYALEIQADSDNSTVLDLGDVNVANFLGVNQLLVATGFLTPGDNGDPDENFAIKAAPLTAGPLLSLAEAVGRADLNIAQLNAYPNPAHTNFNIGLVLSEKADLNVQLIDMQGRTVYSDVVTNATAGTHTLQIDVDGMANGLYVYRVEANGQTMSGKMSIMR